MNKAGCGLQRYKQRGCIKSLFNRKEREAGAMSAKIKHCKCVISDLCEISLRPLQFIFFAF